MLMSCCIETVIERTDNPVDFGETQSRSRVGPLPSPMADSDGGDDRDANVVWPSGFYHRPVW